ncbi:HAMP domain-containing histidine kinase [Desulfohalobiaceae bacterium Ax17]|uniref:hypothetical protein n=1 Tax=Desulfovulcanus ferrireducens TaxID=2831190 RepID=UPI00207B9B02|nr:hypothetical protein [Desulfovulcanus ferrireducens]MBT8764049.1 HAMP domain-containing histidine kinase [Desulfovulcanus ferrireducens]
MNFSPEQQLAFVQYYLDASCGGKLYGLMHNLNNVAHILDMQLALLNSVLTKNPLTTLKDQSKRLGYLNQGSKKLLQALDLNSQRAFYLQQDQVEASPNDFLHWLEAFWQNDLFFKHKVKCQFNLAQNIPVIECPAFALTFCIEHALANAVEAYKQKDPESEHDLVIMVLPYGNGVEFKIISRTKLSVQDPWQPWQTTKPGHLGLGLTLIKFLCSRLNWTASLTGENGDTVFSLKIPDRKSLLK